MYVYYIHTYMYIFLGLLSYGTVRPEINAWDGAVVIYG